MKAIMLTSLILLSGCQITVAKLPDPVPADVAEALKQHAQILDVLAKEYQERNKDKK